MLFSSNFIPNLIILVSTSSLCRHVFEDLYSITIVQSVVRMHLAINDAVDRLSSIIAIQSWWRGIKARDGIEEMDYSAVAIQSNWRRYLAQMSYQFDIIDIIIVQSVARRWKTRRHLASIRIQCLARVMFAKARIREKSAMQTLVTRHTSATKIQSSWRSYTAQVHMLISIVNVIVIQVSKIARGFGDFLPICVLPMIVEYSLLNLFVFISTESLAAAGCYETVCSSLKQNQTFKGT